MGDTCFRRGRSFRGSARRPDGEEIVEVEIYDCPKRFTGDAVAQGFWESVESGGIFGLQDNEFGGSIAPALAPASAVGGSPVMDHRPCRCPGRR